MSDIDGPREGLYDTSVFVALEAGRSLRVDLLPEIVYASSITAAEIEWGVLAAAHDPAVQSRRLVTWNRLLELELLDTSLAAAHEWALLRRSLQLRGRRAAINDLWIAAIALANGLPVVTRDDGFDVLADLGGPVVIKV